MTERDWRAGELTMLLLALVLAVAALSSVGFLADRLHLGLERDARRMIGADFIVRSDHPVDPQFSNEAKTLGLQMATTAIFPSMISSAGAQPVSRLAALKAVSQGYPLRGALRITRAPGQPDHPAQGFIFGIVMMGETLSLARVASAALIVIGLIGLKLSSGH